MLINAQGQRYPSVKEKARVVQKGSNFVPGVNRSHWDGLPVKGILGDS